MPGRMEFEFEFSTAGATGTKRHEGALRILLMGDFSGRANRGVADSGAGLSQRHISAVDVDNLDALMERYRPRLQFPLGESTQTLEFSELEDFHPDALYQRLELFQSLRKLRKRLVDPETFAQASAELGAEPEPAASANPDPETAAPEQDEGNQSMFERLLGNEPSKLDSTAPPASGVNKFIRDIVAPHIVNTDAEQQDAYIDSVDDAISAQMRSLLHEPAFQVLESAWRSVHNLVSGLETGVELKLHLVDVSKDELAADVIAVEGNLERSGLYKLLVEQGVKTQGGEPWSLLVGDYSFEPHSEDMNLLAALGAIASQAGGPFLAGASSGLVGSTSLLKNASPESWSSLEDEVEQHWQALRESSVAPWIGLALPRVLLRLPYGSKTDEIDSFQFEEIVGARSTDHESLLWGNPGYVCAMLLGLAFQERGWNMQLGDMLDIEDLPTYIFYDEDGDRQLMPCAESLLSEKAGDAILNRGLMPLLSYKNRNAVRVLRFQSIASPARALAGPWI